VVIKQRANRCNVAEADRQIKHLTNLVAAAAKFNNCVADTASIHCRQIAGRMDGPNDRRCDKVF
jgi:hypothetical protein